MPRATERLRRVLTVCLALLGMTLLASCSTDRVEIKIGSTKGKLTESDSALWVEFPEDTERRQVSREELLAVLGEEGLDRALDPNPWFRFLSISSWGSLTWVLLGFAGQAAFFGRMLVQWLASEKNKRSVVPEVFWWLSLFGAIALLTYFIWRREVVGILGQAPGAFVYGRNLWLIRLHRASEAAA
ncbi:MAG: lipid-A-disaccharide synthase N-terminal domain-containing protein [Planctomycetota bacterium]